MAKSTTDKAYRPSSKKRAAEDDISPISKRVTRSMSRKALLQSQKASTNATSPKSLLAMPPEIRNKIYHLAVAKECRIIVKGKKNKFGDEHAFIMEVPPLLQTCSQIRSEAIGIFYHINHFALEPSDWSGSLCHRFWCHLDKLGVENNCIQAKPSTPFGDWDGALDWLQEYHSFQSYPAYPDPFERYKALKKVDYIWLMHAFQFVWRHRYSPWNVVGMELVGARYALGSLSWSDLTSEEEEHGVFQMGSGFDTAGCSLC